MSKSTFISYCKKDSNLVKPIVTLLRTQGEEVFLDSDSILPGQKWEDSIMAAISKSDQLILLWCCHSAESEWVRKEFEIGINLRKPIIPILFCDFPSTKQVGEFQWNDLRNIIEHKCKHIEFNQVILAESSSKFDHRRKSIWYQNRKNIVWYFVIVITLLSILLVDRFTSFKILSNSIIFISYITLGVLGLILFISKFISYQNDKKFELGDSEIPKYNENNELVKRIISHAKLKLDKNPHSYYPINEK